MICWPMCTKGSSELYNVPILLRPSSFVCLSFVRSSSLSFHIFDISSNSSWPMLTTLCMNDPQEKGFQSCTNWGARPLFSQQEDKTPNSKNIYTSQDTHYQRCTNLKETLNRLRVFCVKVHIHRFIKCYIGIIRVFFETFRPNSDQGYKIDRSCQTSKLIVVQIGLMASQWPHNRLHVKLIFSKSLLNVLVRF